MSNIEELLAQQRKLDRQGRFEEADQLFKTCGAFDSFSNAGLGAIESHGQEGDGKSEIRLELGESKLRPSSWFRQLKSVVVPMPVQYVQRYHAMPNLVIPMKVAVQIPSLKAILRSPSTYSAEGNTDEDQHRLNILRNRDTITAYITANIPEAARQALKKSLLLQPLTPQEEAAIGTITPQQLSRIGELVQGLQTPLTPMRRGDSITNEGAVIRRNRIGGMAKEISLPYELCASNSDKRKGNLSAIYDKAAGGGQVVELMLHTLHSATGITPEDETNSNVIGDTAFEQNQPASTAIPAAAPQKQSWIERITQRLNNATRENILSDLPNLTPEQQARIQELSRALNNAHRNLTDKENKLATGRTNGTITTEREANLLEQIGYYQNLIAQITHDIRMVQYS